MTIAIRFLFLLTLFTLPVQAEIPDTLEFDGANLVLNGTGVRKKFMMKMYDGGLYLGAKSSDAAAIIAADEAMSIRLDILSSMITSENMEEALVEGMDNATGGDTAPLQQYTDVFMEVFSADAIKEGDVFDISYTPGKGIGTYKNGTFMKTIDGGMPFKQAIFGIWLGDKPADKNLKSGMLGK
jgi:hypothetical protein